MTSKGTWDWHTEDRDSVVVESVQAIAVYTNIRGEIVVRQQDTMGEDDSVIHIPRKMVDSVIKALRAEVKKEFTPE